LTKEEKQRLRKEKKQSKKNKKDDKVPTEKEKEKASVQAPSKPVTQSPTHKGTSVHCAVAKKTILLQPKVY